ncbi:hypothetical protein BCY76_010350 [Nesterenkonia sp. PF2B19]|nr:hypothetical protein BCY76_010350 [Nesterenkonia sp. PF2B19]
MIGAEAAAHEITEPAQHEPAPSEPADPTSESDVTGPESAQSDDDGAARDSEAGPGTDTQPAVSSDTGEVRMSRPTPVLPPEARPEEKEAGLSEFFDTLDARFAAATEKLAHAFRRPEPGEQIAAPLDPRRAQGHVVDPIPTGRPPWRSRHSPRTSMTPGPGRTGPTRTGPTTTGPPRTGRTRAGTPRQRPTLTPTSPTPTSTTPTSPAPTSTSRRWLRRRRRRRGHRPPSIGCRD